MKEARGRALIHLAVYSAFQMHHGRNKASPWKGIDTCYSFTCISIENSRNGMSPWKGIDTPLRFYGLQNNISVEMMLARERALTQYYSLSSHVCKLL